MEGAAEQMAAGKCEFGAATGAVLEAVQPVDGGRWEQLLVCYFLDAFIPALLSLDHSFLLLHPPPFSPSLLFLPPFAPFVFTLTLSS